MIPGADISAEIIEIGSDVPAGQFHVGQRVAVIPNRDDGMMGETLRGGLCEFLAVDPEFLIPVPDRVTDHQAACLPTAYATAYRMMHVRGNIQKGERVLILGASGGVGTCCVQLAKAAGCEVIAVTSSAVKADGLKAIGADHVINTSTGGYVDFIKEKYGKPRTRGPSGGIDVCVNYTGGDTWTECFRAVKRGGRILTCGATAGFDPKTDLRYIWSFEYNIIGSNGWEREDHVKMLELIDQGHLVPVIDRVVPMTEIGSAMRDLHERRVLGKVVLEV
jgi:alcohol dehydrogenase